MQRVWRCDFKDAKDGAHRLLISALSHEEMAGHGTVIPFQLLAEHIQILRECAENATFDDAEVAAAFVVLRRRMDAVTPKLFALSTPKVGSAAGSPLAVQNLAALAAFNVGAQQPPQPSMDQWSTACLLWMR